MTKNDGADDRCSKISLSGSHGGSKMAAQSKPSLCGLYVCESPDVPRSWEKRIAEALSSETVDACSRRFDAQMAQRTSLAWSNLAVEWVSDPSEGWDKSGEELVIVITKTVPETTTIATLTH